ncbi:PEGA domain-containing protein, partial [candidate division KSB1 bacterium]|nr:PEGA domain-containing protein [candidate division KSB1 bacterium]
MRWQKWGGIWLGIFCGLLLTAGFGQGRKTVVAILDLETAGIDSTAIIGLSNRLRAEILKTGQFEVMERNRMQEILFEQGFQQTGACNTDECAIEAGRLLGVSQMMVGSVGKVGRLFAVTVRIIDVATGAILVSVAEDTPGPLENILTTTLRNVAQTIAARAAHPSEELTGFGSLYLNSTPPGASIFLDDHRLAGVTPRLIDSLVVGVHVVRLQQALLAASRAIFVAPGETTRVQMELTEARGKLKIISEPAGAEIFLDYRAQGVTPRQLLNLPVGAYYLKLVKPGFVDFTQIVSVPENETRIITARLTSLAWISLIANPTDCQVALDDSLIGTTPLTAFPVKPGFHKLSLRKSGFVPFEEIRSVPAGDTLARSVQLVPVANLHLTSEPPAAKVTVNGNYYGVTPLQITDLKPGLTQLKLELDLFEDQITALELSPGETRVLDFQLQPKRGKLIVESLPSAATVEVDGQARGATPLEVAELSYGKHLVRVLKTGYKTFEQTLEINSSVPALVRVKFEIGNGTLFLLPKPNDAFIFLNGKRLNRMPGQGLTLFPGEYQLSALRPGYEKYFSRVQIEPNAAESVTLVLTPKSKEKALLRSLIFPGWGQRYGEKKTRAWLLAGLEAGTLLGIGIADAVVDQRTDQYYAHRQEYLQAIPPDAIEQTRRKMDTAYSSM